MNLNMEQINSQSAISRMSRRSSIASLENDASISLMAHLAALRHGEPGATLILLHQQLGITEIVTECSAFAVIACVLLGRLQIHGWTHLVFGYSRGRRGGGGGWDGIYLHFRFHVHTSGLILQARRQTVPMLPKMFLRVAQKWTEHVRTRASNAHRTHGIRSTFCNRMLLLDHTNLEHESLGKYCDELISLIHAQSVTNLKF